MQLINEIFTIFRETINIIVGVIGKVVFCHTCGYSYSYLVGEGSAGRRGYLGCHCVSNGRVSR